MNDLKFAFRQLLKNPGFTCVAVLTLALGIGANTAIFSVVNAVLLRRLPYPNAERLVWIEEVSKQSSQEPWGAHFLDWQKNSRSLQGIATYDGSTRTLAGAGEAERVDVGEISASFLPLFGAQELLLGRNFDAAEDRPGGQPVAVLGHDLWQRRFKADPEIIGRAITLNDTSFTVIGVLSENFRFFGRRDLWVPLALDPQRELAGDTRFYGSTVACLKPGVSIEQARAELDALLQRYETTRPAGIQRITSRARLVPLQVHLLGDTRRALLVLLGAVALVLLIACANVANLLLARAVTRQKELAIRAALGAGRLRLTRQMLTETLLLAMSGGVVGLILAYWLTRLLSTLSVTDTIGQMARVAAIRIDLHVFGFALLLSLLTGLLFGHLPFLRLSQTDLNASLKEGGRGSKSHGRHFRGTLMASEVALAIVLLVGAGLLIRSFIKLLEVNPGYRAESLLTARFQLPPRYSEKLARVQFCDRLLQRVSELPGVTSVGATSHLPLTPYNLGGTLSVEGRMPQAGEPPVSVPMASVNADYFRTMGIPLRAGRLFNDGDAPGTAPVALLSETLARRLFPDEDPIGKRLRAPLFGEQSTTVIGLVGDIRHEGLDRGIEQAVYFSYRQLPRPAMSLVVQSSAGPAGLASALRHAVREIDPALPVYEVMTMNERLSNSVAARRFNLLLLGGFAGLALLLAALGVYGVIAYVVTERTQEVGIRMALGAKHSDVIALVLRQGLTVTCIGIAFGLVAAFGLARVLTNLLYETKPSDPVTFVCVSIILLLVASLACWLPARRAANVDPMQALRYE